MSLVNTGQLRTNSIGEKLTLGYDPKVAVALPAGELARATRGMGWISIIPSLVPAKAGIQRGLP
jgi:hypothetical protein